MPKPCLSLSTQLAVYAAYRLIWWLRIEPRLHPQRLQSKTLSVELLSYNAELHVLGYIKGAFQWQQNGLVEAVFTFMGMPALDYLTLNVSIYSAFAQVRSCLTSEVTETGGSGWVKVCIGCTRVSWSRCVPEIGHELACTDVFVFLFNATQVFARELLPLWILTLFFTCYSIFRLATVFRELGQGHGDREGFSSRRALSLLMYHVSVDTRWLEVMH